MYDLLNLGGAGRTAVLASLASVLIGFFLYGPAAPLAGTPVEPVCEGPVDCDDGDLCTEDTCVPPDGEVTQAVGCGDTNGDGIVVVSDALMILRCSIG